MKALKWKGFFALPLGRQIVLLLLLALLPILVFAVFSAMRAGDRAEMLAAGELLSVADRAATAERLEIAEGFGAAKTMARTSLVRAGDPAACSAELARFIAESNRYVFASFTGTDGITRCSSRGMLNTDISDTDMFQRQQQQPHRAVSALPSDNASRQAVLDIIYPVHRDDVWLGVLALAVPRSEVTLLQGSSDQNGLQVALIDWSGRLLRAVDNDDAQTGDTDWLPNDADLASIAGGLTTTHVFRTQDRTGFERLYAYVPIEPGAISGVFSVTQPSALAPFWRTVLAQIALPIAIWVLCLALAYATMCRLVVVPIRNISRRMTDFRVGNRSSALRPIAYAPGEFDALATTFRNMAREMDQSERDMAHLLDEKSVLLLEVYHRVKNNLQLIISIMNIQLRAAKSDSERATIVRLRERIMGLALVHQRLYETPNVSAVPIQAVLSEIVVNLSENADAGGSATSVICTDFDEVVLHPDQAVPLSLLVTEALLNTLRRADLNCENARIDLSMHLVEDNDVHLSLTYTMDAAVEDAAADMGMTRRLMEAFVMQLGGEMSFDLIDDTKQATLTVQFSRIHPELGVGMMGAPGGEGLRKVS